MSGRPRKYGGSLAAATDAAGARENPPYFRGRPLMPDLRWPFFEDSHRAFAAEIEVVPERVATEISKRTSLLLLSMGGGCRLPTRKISSRKRMPQTV